MIEKALVSQADLVFIDLEDAVVPEMKEIARQHAVGALREADWQGRPRAVRVNGLGSRYFYRDLIEVVEAAGDRLDLVIVPKVERKEDIYVVATLLGQIESAIGKRDPVRLHAQIETAQGLLACRAIAGASARLDALAFGAGDYAASLSMPSTAIGVRDAWDRLYPGDRFGYAMHEILVAGRAAGVQVIDGPYADFRDQDGLRAACLRARALGYDGKWCIHPAQIPIVNEIFTPAADELEWAQETLAAYERSRAGGQGALALGSTMVDAASVRMAERTLARARAAGLIQ
jgi:citrate lyase subunit beta/citryl-CoA lyase